mmetsp:Transcript_6402/g.10700  ORF Transcript_6402/g.10700 Transcript_6402/m.10700 type:complete len:204 (-) Transcript_6402:2560-3171(-)
MMRSIGEKTATSSSSRSSAHAPLNDQVCTGWRFICMTGVHCATFDMRRGGATVARGMPPPSSSVRTPFSTDDSPGGAKGGEGCGDAGGSAEARSPGDAKGRDAFRSAQRPCEPTGGRSSADIGVELPPSDEATEGARSSTVNEELPSSATDVSSDSLTASLKLACCADLRRTTDIAGRTEYAAPACTNVATDSIMTNATKRSM